MCHLLKDFIMKRLYRILFMSLALAAAVSCYKDNGNYDYTTEPTAITIDDAMRRNMIDPSKEPFVFKLGEPIEIPAKYTINDPMLKPENISIEWYFADQLVSTGETFTMENLPAGRYTGIIIITDLRYDQKYMLEFSFQVEGAYSNGYVIVSEKSGASLVSYLEIDANTGEYVFKDDVYGKSNEGASLPAGIRSASYHMFGSYPQVFALSLGVPGDGAVDIDCNSMTVIGNFNKEFVTSPGNVEVKDVAYMTNMSGGSVYALTTDGKLYVREEAVLDYNIVPHAGVYPSLPLATTDGYEISHWVNTAKVSVMMTSIEHLIAYDKKNFRCVELKGNKFIPFTDEHFANSYEPNRKGPGFDGENYYDDIVFPEPHDLSGYNVKAMYGVGLDTDFLFSTGALSICMILEKEGQNYFYSFTFYDSWGTVDVDLDLFFPIPDEIGLDPDTMLSFDALGGPNHIMYFTANGNKDLYYINAINGTMKKVYTSESKITGIGPGQLQDIYAALGMSDYTPYFESFVIGTEDGNMKVVKMDNVARAQGVSEVLYETNPGIGEIKYVRYMGNSQISF